VTLAFLTKLVTLHPRDPPRRYPEFEPRDVRAKITSIDDNVSKELLSEAEAVFAETNERVASVDRRAATFQGSVAIAATVVLSGGGLILDRNKVPDDGWRLALGIALALLLVLLCLAGWRATAASARIFSFIAPSDTTLIDERAAFVDAASYRRHRAAYLLWAYGRNSEIAAVKVTYLNKAAFWFRWALVVLVMVMLLMLAFVAVYDWPLAGSK
jgi:hypothetical protein